MKGQRHKTRRQKINHIILTMINTDLLFYLAVGLTGPIVAIFYSSHVRGGSVALAGMAIAVFWVDAEDHDWEEVRSCSVLDGEFRPRTVTLAEPVGAGELPVTALNLDGRIEQTNFSNYDSMRIAQMPKVEAIIMPSGGFWGGVGEPTICVAAPAVLNAFFAATGRRIRTFPLKNHGVQMV